MAERVVKAGTTPLPYVSVGMVLGPRYGLSNSAWRVVGIVELEGRTLVWLRRQTLDGVLQKDITSRYAPTVRDEWELVEDFDPNGCPTCGCTSMQCGCVSVGEP